MAGPVLEGTYAGRGDREIHGAAPGCFVTVPRVEHDVAVEPCRIQNTECLRIVEQGTHWNLSKIRSHDLASGAGHPGGPGAVLHDVELSVRPEDADTGLPPVARDRAS